MSPEYKLHFNRNHKYDKCVTATSMYTLNDSSVTIIPNTKMNLKDVNMRKEGIKSREKEWKMSKNFNEKATDTPLTKKLSSNEILLHSDFPFDIRRSILSLKPLDLMVLIGYSFSTDCDHHEHESNILIAKDIFQFVTTELYRYCPCLRVLLMRHNIDKQHWKTHQFISNYASTFDIRIALCDDSNKRHTKVLFHGSKFDLRKRNIFDTLTSFMGKLSVKKHLLHPLLIRQQRINLSNDDSDVNFWISYPPLYTALMKDCIDHSFGCSDVLYSEKLPILDARAHSSHPKFKNGTQVKVLHAVNQWGGCEAYSVLGQVCGCFSHSTLSDDTTGTSVLYIKPIYDHTGDNIITANIEHCFLVDDTSEVAKSCDCPPLGSTSDNPNDLPMPLKVLLTSAQKIYEVGSSYSLEDLVKFSNNDSTVLSSEFDNHLDLNQFSSFHYHHSHESDCVANFDFELRSALYNSLHELSWRVIDCNARFTDVLQQAYSEEMISWITKHPCVQDIYPHYSSPDRCAKVILSELSWRVGRR